MTTTTTRSWYRTRRAFLLQSTAVAVLTGTGAISACSKSSIPKITEVKPVNFTEPRFQRLARLCQLLIPKTDTDGAFEANVPQFVDRLLVSWASSQTRLDINAALDGLDEASIGAHNKPFLHCSDTAQIETLRVFEEGCFAETSIQKTDQERAPLLGDQSAGYRNLKKLIYRGYYHSETGCYDELQYDLVPGADARFDAPLSEVGRTWVA